MDNKTIVAKIGSRVLTQEDGQLNKEAARALIEDIARLKKEKGIKVVIVTSGAVNLGRSALGSDFGIDEGASKKYGQATIREQILASVGQPKLMTFYDEEFKKHGFTCAQIVATRADFADRDRYMSLKTVTSNLLRLGIVPIFNENDVLSPEELDFSDNDQLASMVAAMLVADSLMLLTNVGGVLDKSPNDPAAKVIPVINEANQYIKNVDTSARSGKGGMESKLMTADLVTSLGISVHIANGLEKNVLLKLTREDVSTGTFFPPRRTKKVGATRGWLATAAMSEGKIIVSTFIADILRKKQTASILFTGIEKIEGNFSEKDVVEVCDDDGVVLGKGMCKHSAEKLAELMEEYKKKSDVEKAKTKAADIVAIHYDYFMFL